MSRQILLIVAIGAFAAGFAAGMFLRREPAAATGKPSRAEEKRSAAPSMPAPASSSPAPSDEASIQIQKTVEIQKERIRELEARLVEAERKGGGTKTKAEKLALAKEIYQTFLRLSKGAGDSDESLKAISRLGELDADMASYFVERYREGRGKENAEEENMALFLALASGGPEVSALILNLLTDPSAPAKDRQLLLQNLSGMGGFYSMNRIPVNDELSQVAYRLSSSQELAERQGAAGLLGGVDTFQSRSALQQMAFNDADLGVRAAALRSLGYAGDRSTLQFLETYVLPASPAATPENAWQTWQYKAMTQALEAAKERLKKRFPP